MRTSIAVIKLVLRTNKTLADGTFPIMLRVNWKGMKEKSTGYSCSAKYWDKVNQCVKKGYPNFVMVNYELKKMKDEAIRKRDAFVASGETYSPAMILSNDYEKNNESGDLKYLIEKYISEKGIKPRTIEHWWVVYKSIKEMTGRDILINEINESFCRRYAKYLENEGKKDCTIRGYLSKIAAICHYAIDDGIISSYPFSKWRYNRIYQESKREYYVHQKSLMVLKEIFVNACVTFNKNGLWHYKEGVIEDLMDRNSRLYSLFLFIGGIVFKGLAPIDMSYLKKSDVNIIRIGDKDYYKIDGAREKTGMKFKIRIDREDILSKICVETFLMFHTGDYLFPTMDGFIGTCAYKRISNTYINQRPNLNYWLKLCNDEIIKRNVEGDNIPLIDIESCNYYAYRHTFVMGEVQKPNCNFIALAQMIGKSVNTLYQYISELTHDEDLV